MKKRSRQSTNVESPVASPSSPSSSSSSSCIVDDRLIINNNSHVEDEKPSKPKRTRRKTVSINKNNNTNLKNQKCTANANANTPNPNPPSNRRSSIYRGVTRHRWTGRFEAHLWDKSSWNNVQNKKGRQVYLGAYDSEVDAARTYDLAALKYWGPETTLNFPIENYTKELEEMQNASKEEYLASLRRRSSGFSRGVSKYRGVARHHHNGRWEARIGRVFGNKYLYLGTFSSQEEAAAAYDLAAIEYRGPNAVTNFDISNYIGRVKNLMPKDQSAQPNPAQAKVTLPQKLKKQLIKQQKEEEQQDDQPEVKIQPDLEDQVEDQQDQQIDIPCHELEEAKLINAMEHPSILAEMDVTEDERENPWSFCLDTGGYDPLLVPHIPFEEDGKLLDLFDETGFEDNIDMIFDGEAGNSTSMDGTYFNDTEALGCQTRSNTSEGLDKKAASSPKAEENSLSYSSSSPSSPSSISSLVSCQV